MGVEQEIELLVQEIKRLGTAIDGKTSVKFGVLVRDDQVANIFEGLVGTLKAAKKRKVIAYSGEILLQGVSDQMDVTLL